MRVLPALLLLLPLAACRDKSAKLEDSVSQALAQAGSAQAAAASGQGFADNMQAVASAVAAESKPVVTGTVHSAGGDLGTWDIVLDTCRSGEGSGFYGADFYVSGSDDVRLRYVHDEAAGDVVKLAVPSKPGTMLVLDRSAKCSVLEGTVQKMNFTTGTMRGTIRHVTGHVKFDCTHTGGKGHVTGEATFSHCH